MTLRLSHSKLCLRSQQKQECAQVSFMGAGRGRRFQTFANFRCALCVDGKEQSTKSENADRVIDVQQQLADTILRHLRGRTDSWVFQSRAGTPLCHSHVIQRVLHALPKKLGIPRSRMHAFRHGRVSYLVECDMPNETIRAWIGHRSGKMVRRYTHLSPAYRKRILSVRQVRIFTDNN